MIGETGDIFLNPTSYVYGLNAGIRFNNKTDQAESTRQLLTTEFDPYALNKLYFSRKRAIEVSNTQPAMKGEDRAQTQTSRADRARKPVLCLGAVHDPR